MSRICSPGRGASRGNKSAPNFHTNACLASYKSAFQADRRSCGSFIAWLVASLFASGTGNLQFLRVVVRKSVGRAVWGGRQWAESSARVLRCRERRANGSLGAQNICSERSLGETTLTRGNKFRAGPSAFRTNRDRDFENLTVSSGCGYGFENLAHRFRSGAL